MHTASRVCSLDREPTDDWTPLLLAAREGDRVALSAWIRRSQRDVWRLCAGLVGRRHADDVTQEVYLRALKALPRYRAEASARTWLLAIARRTCVDTVRQLSRYRRLQTRLRQTEEIPDPTGPVDLAALLDGLDPDRRAAIVLTQVVGLSYAGASAACDCPVGTIRSRVARAREELVDKLTDQARRVNESSGELSHDEGLRRAVRRSRGGGHGVGGPEGRPSSGAVQ